MKKFLLVLLALVTINAALRIVYDVVSNPIAPSLWDASTLASWNGVVAVWSACLAWLVSAQEE